MKLVLASFLFIISLGVQADKDSQEWEALDLEETHMKEMEEQHRQGYEDREGDLQIQAEEEEILPLESEDSREFKNRKAKEESE